MRAFYVDFYVKTRVEMSIFTLGKGMVGFDFYAWEGVVGFDFFAHGGINRVK